MSREKLQDILVEMQTFLRQIKADRRDVVEIRLRPKAFRWLVEELKAQLWYKDPTLLDHGHRFMGHPLRIDERLNPSGTGNGYWFWIETIDRLSPRGKG